MTHINQFLAGAVGISRRAADVEIKAGRVYINGRVALPPDRVQEKDVVRWKGKEFVVAKKENTTIMLNKPAGYVTSRVRDESGAPTVMELLPKELQHLKPVGRLDKESEGLLLLTDDGNFLYESTHPKFEEEKEYIVEFENPAHDTLMRSWIAGVKLTDGIAKADVMERLGRKKFRVVLHQGMNRQIRRMAGKTKNSVATLRRVRSGKIVLGSLRLGKWKKVESKLQQ